MTENQAEPVEPEKSVESAEPLETTALTPEPAATPESESEPTPEAEPGPESVSPSSAPAPAPKKPVRRGRIAAVVGCALLAVALVGGVGYTVVTVNGADRDAGAPTWRFPKAAAEQKAATAKGLRGMLMPYDDTAYVRGPDIAQFGADAQLSGREAIALRKQEISGLPRSQRLVLEKQIDREQIKGIAMRSYLYPSAQETNAFTIDVQLAQMDEKALRDVVAYQGEVLDALTVFRKGPAVGGHKNARCFLPSKEAGEKLNEMFCSAYEGDVLVTLTASGTRSMDTKEIASFLGQQLDHVKTTGEAV